MSDVKAATIHIGPRTVEAVNDYRQAKRAFLGRDPYLPCSAEQFQALHETYTAAALILASMFDTQLELLQVVDTTSNDTPVGE